MIVFLISLFQFVHCVSVVPPRFGDRGSVQLFAVAVQGGMSDLNGLSAASFIGKPDDTFSVGASSSAHPGAWKPNIPNARLALRFTTINRLVCVNQILIYENNGPSAVVSVVNTVDQTNVFSTDSIGTDTGLQRITTLDIQPMMLNAIRIVASGSASSNSEILAVAVNIIPDWVCGVRYASEAIAWTSAYGLPGREDYEPQALVGRPTVFSYGDSPDAHLPLRTGLSTVDVSFGELFCAKAVQFYFNRGGPAIVKLEAAISETGPLEVIRENIMLNNPGSPSYMVQKIDLEPPVPIFVLRFTISNGNDPNVGPQIDAVALLDAPEGSCVAPKKYYHAVNVVSYSTVFGSYAGFDEAYKAMQALGPADSFSNTVVSDILCSVCCQSCAALSTDCCAAYASATLRERSFILLDFGEALCAKELTTYHPRGSWALVNVSTSLQPSTGFQSVFSQLPVLNQNFFAKKFIPVSDKMMRFVRVEFDATSATDLNDWPYLDAIRLTVCDSTTTTTTTITTTVNPITTTTTTTVKPIATTTTTTTVIATALTVKPKTTKTSTTDASSPTATQLMGTAADSIVSTNNNASSTLIDDSRTTASDQPLSDSVSSSLFSKSLLSSTSPSSEDINMLSSEPSFLTEFYWIFIVIGVCMLLIMTAIVCYVCRRENDEEIATFGTQMQSNETQSVASFNSNTSYEDTYARLDVLTAGTVGTANSDYSPIIVGAANDDNYDVGNMQT